MEEPAQQKWDLTQGTLAPVTTSLYSDPTLVKKFPYLPTLLKSIQTAVPRPVTPFYPGRHRGDRDERLRSASGAEVNAVRACRYPEGDPIGLLVGRPESSIYSG